MSLQNDIKRATEREDNDDHLTDNERHELVQRYRETFPRSGISDDDAQAYIDIIYGVDE